ncbi:MAG: hypothetical protein GC155_00155 [Alphaproteobacteria bacterium]|nr:hypothetical protein [Alphaproteobacteria bacterium]
MKAMMAIAVGMALATMAGVEGVAHADSPCASEQASIYFEKDRSDVTPASREIVDRLAAQAKSCRRAQVVADAPQGALHDARANALRRSFAQAGVHVVLASSSPLQASASIGEELVLGRSAVLRVEPSPPSS